MGGGEEGGMVTHQGELVEDKEKDIRGGEEGNRLRVLNQTNN